VKGVRTGADISAEAAGVKVPPIKTKSRRSGTYLYAGDYVLPAEVKHLRRAAAASAIADARLLHRFNPWFGREEVRLDIDGDFPQMVISGTGWNSFALLSHWIARLTQTGTHTYHGVIFYPEPKLDEWFYFEVTAIVGNDPSSGDQILDLVFMNADMVTYARRYTFQTQFFRKIELEFDYVAGVVPITSFHTSAHPNRPSTLVHEDLGIETILERAGFDTTLSGNQSEVPLAGALSDAAWEDKELHDAMQVHWSSYAERPQWALWTLFAGLHSQNYLGVMFDWQDLGGIPNPYHRQGCAIFESGLSAAVPWNVQPGDVPSWIARQRVFTAVHEIGHCLNLAHPHEGHPHSTFWIEQDGSADNEFTLTFMNHPINYLHGHNVFFQNFEFRFSDNELLFLRHAPGRFVEPGNSAWMTNHAFQRSAEAVGSPDFELRLSTASATGRFAYLVPPVIEAALINRSTEARNVPASQFADQAGLVVMIGSEDGPMRQWLPYLNHCGMGESRTLLPGEALYDSLVVGAGRTGWNMTRPGRYGVQAVLRIADRLVFSNPLTITVEAPASRAEERLAVDFFTPEVGRVLAVNGSRIAGGVNDVLARALELKQNPVSKLAAMALALPLALDFKQLEVGPTETPDGRPRKRFTTYKADPAALRALLAPAAQEGAEGLIETMGHARYLREVPALARLFGEEAPPRSAAAKNSRRTKAEPLAAILPVGGSYADMLASKSAGLTW
jgi:hypothetical protein